MDINQIISDALDMFDEPMSVDGKYNRDGNVLLLKLANRIYVDVCERTRCHRTSTAISTVAGTREYALPADYVAVKKVLYGDLPLIPVSESRAVNNGGVPSRYYIVGTDQVGLDPKPQQAYNLELYYYNYPTTTLVGNDTPDMVPERFHYVIAEGITAKLFQYDKGDQSAGYAKWTQIYEASISKMEKLIHKNNKDKFATAG